MSLKSSLMRFVAEGRLKSFDVLDEKKAQILLPSGYKYVIYMAAHYLIAVTDVEEALEEPAAEFFIYNSWDVMGGAAKREAERRKIQVHSFGAFGRFLDEKNGS